MKKSLLITLIIVTGLFQIACGTTTEEMPYEEMMEEEMTMEEEMHLEDIEAIEIDFTPKRTVMETDGVLHSVPLDDIQAGGPVKDGIPPIDDPKFTTVEEANEVIDDDGLGIAVSFDGIDRFYPFQILVWHEIVNDTVGDQPALITYCPLCGTGIVFEPIVNGEQTEFGTSGKLWNSNLVMYDRQTDSYWSQVLGEAIVGKLTGAILKLLPAQNMFYGDWKEQYPDGEVLSTDTGYSRNYISSPYGDYDISESIYFPVDYTDDQFHAKEHTWGIEVDGNYKAYTLEELEQSHEMFTDKIGDIEIEVTFQSEDQTITFIRLDTNKEVVPIYGFWFSWYSVHPETEVFSSQ